MADRKRIIQIVKKPSARCDELPRFHTVMGVIGPFESSLVVADHFVQSVIHRNRLRWRGVMEIEYRNRRMRVLNFGFVVGDILRDQVAFR